MRHREIGARRGSTDAAIAPDQNLMLANSPQPLAGRAVKAARSNVNSYGDIPSVTSGQHQTPIQGQGNIEKSQNSLRERQGQGGTEIKKY